VYSLAVIAALLVVLGPALYLLVYELARRCPKCDTLAWGFRVWGSPATHWRCPQCQCRFHLDAASRKPKIAPERADALYVLDGFTFTEAGISFASQGEDQFVPYERVEGLKISKGFSFKHPVIAALFGLALLAGGILASSPVLQIISGAALDEALPDSSVLDEAAALTLGPGCVLFGAWLVQGAVRRMTFVHFSSGNGDHRFSLEGVPRRRHRRAFLTFLESKTNAGIA